MKKLILILFLLNSTICFAQEQVIKIHFVDIGEGDAIFIQAEGESALIDTGNLLSGYKLVDYLKENNVAIIKHLLITHPNLDHLSGVFFIIPKFKIENFFDNGRDLDATDRPIFGWYEKIFRQNKNYKALKENDELKLGDLALKILWPPAQSSINGLNNNSLVIMLTYKEFRCLLTGDIGCVIENELMKRRPALTADLLKVAHHGAQDATCEYFIKRLKPKLAIISVDKNNRRGYPAWKTLDLLKANNIKTYRTDKNGSVVITVDDKANYRIYSEK
jgi:competence protein ComEC